MAKDVYAEFYKELQAAIEPLRAYYDIDKVKTWSVYVWTKGESSSSYNVFDIERDRIVFYDDNHVIPDEVMPIIRNIQSKLL